MGRPSFVIDRSDAESSNRFRLLPPLVKQAQPLARPPISKFHVGAVGLGSSGRIFFGVNLEFPGLPLHHSVHAEQFLITNLSLHNEPRLDYIAVSSAPCGHCRQFLQEIRSAPHIQILITQDDSNDQFNPLSEILPQRFGPHDLLDESAPLLLECRHNGLTLIASPLPNKTIGTKPISDLAKEALEAANKSHAPYSSSPSGVALVDDEGRVYKGWYMESAAYNPSLGPVQAAIVAYIVGGGDGYERIVGGVLVEKEVAAVKQEDSARMMLQAVSPGCEFVVVHCTGTGK
ncbi:unnamed protein product [Rhodiola kirilowii]